MPKSQSDAQKFLDDEQLASFVTVDAKSEPHVVPVFFTCDSGRIYVQTDRDSVKVRNLKRNNNIAVAVYRGEEAVIIRGTGRLIGNDQEFVRKTQDHIRKYNINLDERGRDSLGIPLFDGKIRCVIEVIPKRTLFW